MFKRILLIALLAAALVPLAGCRLFHHDCNEYDTRRSPERDCR